MTKCLEGEIKTTKECQQLLSFAALTSAIHLFADVRNVKVCLDYLHELLVEIDHFTDNARYDYFKGGDLYRINLAITLGMIYLMVCHPDDDFYTAYAILAPLMLGARIYFFYKLKQLFYLFDLCYIAGILVWLFVVVYPKSLLLYQICMNLSFGIVAVSLIIWDTLFVFNDLQHFVNMFVHYVPTLVMFHIRTVTMENQKVNPFVYSTDAFVATFVKVKE